MLVKLLVWVLHLKQELQKIFDRIADSTAAEEFVTMREETKINNFRLF